MTVETDRPKIAIVSAEDQILRRQGAIARLAFVESGSYPPDHELENWLSAESKLIKALSCGMTVRDEDILLGIDAKLFEEGTIEIWVSPELITICGKPRRLVRKVRLETGSEGTEEMIFHVLESPVGIAAVGGDRHF